jgi:pimeloyl-ACP methyl ester carboxylesterase
VKRPVRASDLRAYARLAIDATLGATDLVESVHGSVLGVPRLGPAADRTPRRTRGVTGLVYRSIRRITNWVGRGVDGALERIDPLLVPASGESSTRERDAVLAALNGVFGDHLESTASPLAISMGFRCPAEKAGGRILLLAHGLCMNDLQWRRTGHDHGAALAADLGWSPVYLRYNTGRSLAINGRDLARELEKLVREWPQPVTEIAILGHSMGGLVARVASSVAETDGLAWRSRLRRIVFLGTPHHGAPLERGGHWLTRVLGSTSYTSTFARLGRIRSAGITDLREGVLRMPLPKGVDVFAAAAVLAGESDHFAGRALGDGLVPVDSALGDHADPSRALAIPEANRWVAYRTNHLQLLDRGETYGRIRGWLGEPG